MVLTPWSMETGNSFPLRSTFLGKRGFRLLCWMILLHKKSLEWNVFDCFVHGECHDPCTSKTYSISLFNMVIRSGRWWPFTRQTFLTPISYIPFRYWQTSAHSTIPGHLHIFCVYTWTSVYYIVMVTGIFFAHYLNN
jgi:hypothetical protein